MAGAKGKGAGDESKRDIDAGLDALFKLPLAEFTAARNDLAARMKKAGHNEEAARVKALAKPSVSAWAVNQLYWRHRDAFDALIAAGQRFGRAHASQLAGKSVDIRKPLEERREALSDLLHLADGLLREAGHGPAPDTIRRLTTTLEALSIYSLFAEGPSAGRLSEDIDPPGFEALAALVPGAPPAAASGSAVKRADRRNESVAAAKAALQAAEEYLREKRAVSNDLAAALKRAEGIAETLEKNRRQAEEHLENARSAAEEARQRVLHATAEAEEAARNAQNAERDVEQARLDLKHRTAK